MERIAGHYDKIILTLIMCLAVLFMATFTPFSQSAKAVAVVDDAIIAIIIAGLAAVGITFVTTGGFDTLTEYVGSLFDDFATDQGQSASSLLSGCQSGSDKLGRILLNNTFVQLISLFGSWLITHLNLSDNSSITLQAAGTSIDGYTSYELPITFQPIGSYERDDFSNYVNTAYAVIGYPSNNRSRWQILFWNIEPFTIRRVVTYRNNNGTDTSDLSSNLSASGIYYILISSTSGGYTQQSWGGEYITNAELNTLYNSLVTGNAEIETSDVGISVSTGTIVLPEDDENYTDGDGAIIDLDAAWGMTYQDILDDVIPDDFSDSKEGTSSIEYVAEEEVAEAVESTSEITNLPAGTIPFAPGVLPEISLQSIWHYVAQWIADTAIAAGTLMAVVIQFPSPIVNLFYATVCLAIIFGLIKGFAK